VEASFIQAGGHRLEYRWIRPNGPVERKPVLVFLHEGLGSVALWKDFPERVAAATGCSGLVYSRYGYGRSDPLTEPRQVDYMHREALEVLPQVLDRLGVERPVLVGHSDGASIALIHAGTAKWPVRGLVAMAPHVFVEDIAIASIAQAKLAFETTDLPQRLGRHHEDVASAFWGWNDIWLCPDFRCWNIEPYLPGIRCPVLLVQGKDDQYGTRAQIESIARQVSGPVETCLLSQCGHSPHVDQREVTLQAIARLLGRLGRG
jgi:pimeloyl-ACP methyl ester carboxylesterase